MLFRCRAANRLDKTVETVIHTSLGSLRVACVVGTRQLDGENAETVSAPGDGGYLWEWMVGAVQAELLLCRPTLRLPEHLTVDDCWSALYRVEVTQEVHAAAFSCSWEPGYRWTDWDYDGGEGHLGCNYDDGRNVVSVSTEDELFLTYRAERDNWLPRRLLPIVDYRSPSFNPEIVTLSERGIDVRLPPLLAGERVQIQFTVAWGKLSADIPTTWCVAAVKPSDILAGAGCE